MSRLKQLMDQKHRVIEKEHEITDEQIEIEAALQAKERLEQQRMQPQPDYSAEGAEPEPEALPMPAAIVHSQMQSSGKRTKSGNGVSCEYGPFDRITLRKQTLRRERRSYSALRFRGNVTKFAGQR